MCNAIQPTLSIVHQDRADQINASQIKHKYKITNSEICTIVYDEIDIKYFI